MSRPSFHGIIGKSMLMQEVFRLIKEAARTDVTVLIRGASGTGKELVAQAIHELSQRKKKPFIAVNTGAIPPTMVGSKLFGHERGHSLEQFHPRKDILRSPKEVRSSSMKFPPWTKTCRLVSCVCWKQRELEELVGLH
jgi:transcriptional regulator of aromatic amino acid metabolism